MEGPVKPGGPDVGKQQWLGMMTGGVMLLVLVWAAMQSSDAPDESRADAETGLDAVEKPFGALADLTTGPVEPSLSWPLRSNSMALESTTAPGLDEMVDLARFNFFKDFEYWQRVARSQNIKIYLYCALDRTRRQEQLAARQAQHGAEDDIQAAKALFFSLLDEQQRRLYAGLESLQRGRGGQQRAAQLFGLDVDTVARGESELLSGQILRGRVRQPGGGRPAVEKKRPKS